MTTFDQQPDEGNTNNNAVIAVLAIMLSALIIISFVIGKSEPSKNQNLISPQSTISQDRMS